ncbi:unnamed protein product [Cylicocyclus nassatus]|uniref:F-box domain-containing protein n=1 Tax=Cylicocyclus nassatus TaxID=53992 RepID=A0AA36GN75_CYLNA|nr:unnamed protein product [Cylicocyclus nassatus]
MRSPTQELRNTTEIEKSSQCSENSQDNSNFPFFELPLELCVRILKLLRQDESVSPWNRGHFRDIRLACRAMNDIVEKNRATIGLRMKRIFVGQRSKSYGVLRCLVASTPSDLPKCLDSCAQAYIEQIVFDTVALDSFTIQPITDSLRQNHIHVKGMILYGVDVTCKANLLVDLLKAAKSSILFMIDCKLDSELAELLAHHEIIAEQLQSHFIGSCDSFEVYWSIIIEQADYLKHFIELTLPSITDLGRALVAQTMLNDTDHGRRYRLYRDNGRECDVEVTSRPLKKLEASSPDISQFYEFRSEHGGSYYESASLQGHRSSSYSSHIDADTFFHSGLYGINLLI